MTRRESALIRKARNDPSVYGELYEEFFPKIYTYLWFRVGCEKELAEDLTQETFLRAFQRFSDFKDNGFSYGTYLMAVAHNLLVNHYKKAKALSLEELPEICDDHDFRLEEKHKSELLWKAVHELPLESKIAIFMKYEKDMRVRDIAKLMNKTANAVKLILSRARKKLAQHPLLVAYALAPSRYRTV